MTHPFRPTIRGESRLFAITDYGIVARGGWQTNAILYTWGAVAVRGLFPPEPRVGVNTMYIEFENVADPDDPATAPEFGPDSGLEYYTGLGSDPTHDYLRVPLLSGSVVDVVPGYEAYFSAGQGNRITVFAQTAGTAGVHGKPFSNAANSKACGAVLVSAADPADPAQDVPVARLYYSAEKQMVKPENGQLMVPYRIWFADTVDG